MATLLRKGPRRGLRRRFGASAFHNTQWGESSFAEMAWDQSRKSALRWAIGGVLVGALVALIAFAPATWLAQAIASATQQHVVLADARGTIWTGSAVMVVTGGVDSRDAAALPGRLNWSLGLRRYGLALRLQHACCLNGTTELQVRPGLGRVAVTLVPSPGWIGQWPSAFLSGYGNLLNTMQLGGALRLSSPGLTIESVQGRWRLVGSASIDLINASSRISTLETLGTYRVTLQGNPDPNGPTLIQLSTLEGSLRLSGQGTWSANGVRFQGEASAEEADQAALNNLLNIIGRRAGARSLITIG